MNFVGIGFLGIIYILWIAAFILTNMILAVIVFRDAINLEHPALGISPIVWSGVSFSLPVIGMFVYWLMNHSTLCSKFDKNRSIN